LKVNLRLLMLIALKSTLPVLVMISSTSVPICKRCRARQANRLRPRPLKSTFNVENFVDYADCLGLSSAVSAQFTHKMCVAVKKNSPKLLILGVQGHSSSSILTFLKSSLPVLVMISSMSVPIFNHFHGRRANSGKMTSFRVAAPFSPPGSWGPLNPAM